MPRCRLVLTAVLLSFAGSCSDPQKGEDRTPEWTVSADGIAVVHRFRGQPGKELAFLEEARVHLDQPPGGLGNVIDGVLVGERVYVLDNQVKTVFVFSADGEFLHAFAGEGRGPGDLSDPRTITVIADTIFIADRGNARIAKFTLAGEPVGELSAPARFFTGSPLPDGKGALLATVALDEARLSGTDEARRLTGSTSIWLLSEGHEVQRVHQTPGPDQIGILGRTLPIPYAVIPRLEPHPKGVVLIPNGRSDVALLDGDGVIQEFVWEDRLVGVPDTEWDSLRGEYLGGVPDDRRTLVEGVFAPVARPEIRRWTGWVAVDQSSGDIWIQDARPFVSFAPRSIRLNLDRKEVAELMLPEGSLLLTGSADRVLLRTRGPFDEHLLEIRHVIERPPHGAGVGS